MNDESTGQQSRRSNLPTKTKSDRFSYFSFLHQLILAFFIHSCICSQNWAGSLWTRCNCFSVFFCFFFLRQGSVLLSRHADVPMTGKNNKNAAAGRSRRSCSPGSWLWWHPSSRLVSGRWGPAGRRMPTTHRWRCNDSRIPEYRPGDAKRKAFIHMSVNRCHVQATFMCIIKMYLFLIFPLLLTFLFLQTNFHPKMWTI